MLQYPSLSPSEPEARAQSSAETSAFLGFRLSFFCKSPNPNSQSPEERQGGERNTPLFPADVSCALGTHAEPLLGESSCWPLEAVAAAKN